MQLHISPSLRHVTVFPSKGFKEFIKVKVASKRVSYRMLFYSLLVFTFLLRFVFVLTAVDGIDGENKCTTIGTLLAPFSLCHMHLHTHTHKITIICRHGQKDTNRCTSGSETRRVDKARIFHISKHIIILQILKY